MKFKIKHIWIIIAICFPIISISWIYNQIFISNTYSRTIFIPKGSNYSEVYDILNKDSVLINVNTFNRWAQIRKYPKGIKGGKYVITKGMNNFSLINLLRSGNQSSVKLVFTNVRTKEELAGKLCKNLELDSAKFLLLLNDRSFLAKYSLTPENSISIFIPNTYDIYWNTSAVQLFKKMHSNYNTFWKERKIYAAKLNLTPTEVITLASIVEEETNISDEKPIIAGLYINRLKRGMPLQADPTVKFALNNFKIKRVLTVDTKVDSPYNTYKNKGLPPGPIRIPSIEGIDAVLNYTKHHYLYMCANSDFSGHHAFARTLQEHNENSKAFQAELNRRKIFK